MSDTQEDPQPLTEIEEIWQSLAQMQLAFNRQAVTVRVALNLLQSMGFSEGLLNKIYQLEAVKMLGATGPDDAAEVLVGRKQDIEFLIGEELVPEKVQEILGIFRAEQRVQQEAAAKNEPTPATHQEKAVIFGGGQRIVQ